MSSHISGSNHHQQQRNSAYALLAEPVRRWVWEQGWTKLRDIQQQAIQPILDGNTDILISASTASGKTEAAFLPICSTLHDKQRSGVGALYVSPLKALINDQYERLLALCKHLRLSVFKWHGDVSSSAKRRFLHDPTGILLITPESLEALFVLHGSAIRPLFCHVYHIVIDEMHSFIGTERGRQLQTLLHRIETVINRHIPRIGLSATLGDMTLAEEFMRPNTAFPCKHIVETSAGQELLLQVRGYRSPAIASPIQPETISSEVRQEGRIGHAITHHLFSNLRGSSNLVFANSRSLTEVYCATLREMCEEQLVPVEFWPHHGNLSKALREDTENALKDHSTPATAICTTTLEMGIDIGSVKSIAQIGAPPSVASLRQRLGRSGRRGEPAILRVYIQEDDITSASSPQDMIRNELFQTIATINLLLTGWCEPPLAGTYHFSTFIQQILSMVCQYSAIDALRTWRVLCETGPFSNISSSVFARLLRVMGKQQLLTQTTDGALVLGWKGEKLVNNYEFYSAFTTPKEYTLFAEGKSLGTMPVVFPPMPEMYLTFGGRHWQITDINTDRKIMTLIPAKSGKPPKFISAGAIVFDRIRQEMFHVYTQQHIPQYLDSTARDLFVQGIEAFNQLGLHNRRILRWGADILLFPWRGDRIIYTLYLLLLHRKLRVENKGLSLAIMDSTENAVRDELKAIANMAMEPISLVEGISDKQAEKHDWYLDTELLNQEFAAKNLDLPGAYKTIDELVNECK
jgi:ATP-dependent helicase Lhr and Lhr-like helicase